MSKEKQIQEYETKQLIDELSKMPPMVIATAYLHAVNYTLYGIDVTEKWITATQNASVLEKAYRKGYYDALQRQAKIGWIPISKRLPDFHQDVLLSLRSLDVVTGFRAETEPYFYCRGIPGCYIEPKDILAWMPSPEPYKAESEDNE